MSTNYSGYGYEDHKYSVQQLLVVTGAAAGLVAILTAAAFLCNHMCRRRRHQGIATVAASTNRHDRSDGLDLSIMASLPTFAYQRHEHDGGTDGLQCSVCLSVVQEGEKVRQLPVCKHMFHQECIDFWFYSHSTCPLCRSKVPAKAAEEV